MVPQNILDYLKALSANNTREWFHDNKTWYQQTKTEFELVTETLIAIVKSLDPEIGIVEVKDCTFRIFRDTRFSNNKVPYKTNMGAFVNRGGKKSPFAGYYLHLEPGACFVAGGIYIPEPKVLNAVRQEIYHLTDEFKGIINNPAFKEAFGPIDGEQLKTAPKGFDKAWPDIALLRYKSYNTTRMLADAEVLSPNFDQQLARLFGLMVPFNGFLNKVIADLEE